MKIQVFGPGCSSCKNLHKAVEETVQKIGSKDIEIEYSTDITEMLKLGVMSSPVLVIDGELISSGKVLSSTEIEKIITEKLSGKSIKKDESIQDIRKQRAIER